MSRTRPPGRPIATTAAAIAVLLPIATAIAGVWIGDWRWLATAALASVVIAMAGGFTQTLANKRAEAVEQARMRAEFAKRAAEGRLTPAEQLVAGFRVSPPNRSNQGPTDAS